MELRHYIDAFSSLHTAKVKGRKAPHKAVLLLAIIDLIEETVQGAVKTLLDRDFITQDDGVFQLCDKFLEQSLSG